MIQEITCFCEFVCRWDFVVSGCYKFAEGEVEPCGTGNLCHVGSCGVMCLIRQTVWVVKMCVGAAELTGFQIHLFDKFFGGAGSEFCDCQCHFIGGLEHDRHQCLLNCKFFAGICVDAGTVGFGNTAGSGFSHGKFCRRIQIFTAEETGHDLCDACRILCLISVFGVKDGTGEHVDKDCRFSFDLRRFYPAFDGICIGGLSVIGGVRVGRRCGCDQRRAVAVCGEDRDCLHDKYGRTESSGQKTPECFLYIHMCTFLILKCWSRGRDSVEGAIFTCHEISGFCIRFENSEVPEVHAFAKSV